jgi:hypothetical protein
MNWIVYLSEETDTAVIIPHDEDDEAYVPARRLSRPFTSELEAGVWLASMDAFLKGPAIKPLLYAQIAAERERLYVEEIVRFVEILHLFATVKRNEIQGFVA